MKMQKAIDDFLKIKDYGCIDLKAVLFDMDGVLFDSMKNHTLSWYETISSMDIPCNRDEFYLYEGATGKWTINHIFNRTFGRNATDGETEHIYVEKSRCFNELPQAAPMEGAFELLQQVKMLGLIPVLVTGSGQRSLLERLDKFFPDIFTPDTMVTAFDVRHGKPDPEPYLMGLDKAGVKPFEAIVVENAPLGVQSGVAAGIFTVALNTGPVPDKLLTDAGANLLYSGVPVFNSQFNSLYHLLHVAK